MAKIIALSGHVGWELTAEDIRAELKDAKGGDVEFHVNSPGGFVFEGIEIFNIIRDYEGHTEARIIGLAASMMSYIVLAADKVSAYDNATFMIHNAIAFAIGSHNDMRKVANTLESLSNILAKAYAIKTGKSLDEIKALMDDTTFLFGDEILHEGFIDEIIEAPEDDKHEDDKDKDKESALMGARASVEICFNKVRNSKAANEDFERAVAYTDSLSLLLAEQPQAEDRITHFSCPGTTWTEADYEAAELFNPEAPFPNEHACRIRQPSDFKKDSFRRISRKSDSKTLDIIIGRLKGKTTTTTQAFRYPKDEWSVSEAKKHCTDNKGILFEPASGESSNDNGGCGNGT